jgi:hypothetical protein
MINKLFMSGIGEHWHKCADEARSVADDMKDEISKQMMLQIAEDYERLAKRAAQRFDPETLRILGVAFAQVAIALRIGDCDDDVSQAIANKIIELAKTGERNPDLLCERALKDIRQSPV